MINISFVGFYFIIINFYQSKTTDLLFKIKRKMFLQKSKKKNLLDLKVLVTWYQ